MTHHKLRLLASIAAILFSTIVFAQQHYEGETLTNFLGKDTSSSDLKNLENNYHCEMINENHYLSGAGLELFLMSGVLVQINLYKKSPAYGSFTGRLPRNVTFDMSITQVKSVLGNPTLAYNSGYAEFDMHNYIIVCWFQGDHLSQVGVSSPSAR